MQIGFVRAKMRRLLDTGVIGAGDSLLAVCAGQEEQTLFSSLNMAEVTLSNVCAVDLPAGSPYRTSIQRAENLAFADRSFDICFVSDGLHHCSSPHRALLEMYRVARKCVIAFESRDSLLMTLANRLKLSPRYELEPIARNQLQGGVDGTSIPNYIYRWTEREFMKTVLAADPSIQPRCQFFYGLELPEDRARLSRSSYRRRTIALAKPFIKILAAVAKKQCNRFCMVAIKPQIPGDSLPWISQGPEGATVDFDYLRANYKTK
jgi:SAM-dependent methyltransferase